MLRSSILVSLYLSIWLKRYVCLFSFLTAFLVIETLGADLVTARSFHTATLLPNGKILVVGGIGANTLLASAELYDPATGNWTSTSSLDTPRYWHTATLLPNGMVLVAGGYEVSFFGGLPTARAEFYDPTTGEWTLTGSLVNPHSLHSATLLPDGKVLVAGGNGIASTSITGAELFDPTTGLWSSTGSLGVARRGHASTLLSDGRVLVSGGDPIASSELYDSTSGSWSPTGSLTIARRSHTASLLPNGKVLVTGGNDGSTDITSTELYDPSIGTWSPTSALNNARAGHTAALLPDGQVYVFGGNQSNTNVERFDPETETWDFAGSLLTSRTSHTTTILANGEILIAGGGDGTANIAATERYDPRTDSWSATGSLLDGRNLHTATLLPTGKVLVVGGSRFFPESGLVGSAELYDPTSALWTATAPPPSARWSHTATLLPNGKVLFVGGLGGDPYIVPSSASTIGGAELFDPLTEIWSSAASPSEARAGHTTTLLPDGTVLVTGGISGIVTVGGWGGSDRGTILGNAELYDPVTDSWTFTSFLSGPRAGHSATLLKTGQVLVAGGQEAGSRLVSAELYDPATDTWTPAGSLSEARDGHTATLLPNGQVLVLGAASSLRSAAPVSSAELYDPVSGSWSTTEAFTAALDGHTATLLPNGKVLVQEGNPSSLVSAGLYDPISRTWSLTSSLSDLRVSATATLLTNGKVLLAGGYSLAAITSGVGNTDGSAVELYSVEAGVRPQITGVSIEPPGRLTLTGTGFRGISGGSGGTTNDSPSDIPLVHVRYIDNEQSEFLSPDPADSFSDIRFLSADLPPFYGYGLVTVITNGISSDGWIIRGEPSELRDTDADSLSDGLEFRWKALGFDMFTSQPDLITILDSGISDAGYYKESAYEANRTAGQDDVLTDPNAFDLYSLSQVQALNVDATLLARDPSTGQFTLTIGLEKAPDLLNFQPFPFTVPEVSINVDGKIHFEFGALDEAAFFRVEAK